MKSLLKLTLAASTAMLIATGCSDSSGGSTSTVTPPPTPPPVTAAGKLIDGYLAGALVFADCSGDMTFQSDAEPSTITDADGDFNLSVPASCASATLIASGGTNVDTGLPFSGVLMAPAGSANITPLTTMVAVDPTFAAQIEAYGVDVDVDFTTTAIDSDLLVISQQIATAINIVAFNTKVSDTSALITLVVEPLVSSVVDINDTTNSEIIATASANSIVEIATINPDMNVTSVPSIINSISNTLETIETTIPDGVAVLNPADSVVISDEVIANNGVIEAAVTVPVVTITSFTIDALAPVTSTNNLFVTSATEAEITTTFTASVDVVDAADRNYTVELSMAVGDANSARSANFVVSNILMTTAVGAGTIFIDETQVLSATITGTDANGALFTAVQLTDGTLGDILTSDGTNLTINMAALLSKVQSSAGAGHPLEIFSIPGTYGVTVAASGGIPMEYLNYILNLTIN